MIQEATVFLQWKGTDACFDFTCSCGNSGHIDADFAYYIECGSCGQIWRMPCDLIATPVDRSESNDQAIWLDDGGS